MKKKLIVLLILFLFGYFAYSYMQSKGEKKNDSILTIYGNVDIREVNLSFRVSGLIQAMKLEEGDSVHKGQIIAYLDKNQYTDQLNEANAQVNVQKAQLNKLHAGTRSEEIAQAKAIVKEREATLLNANSILNRNEKLCKVGAISLQEYENSIKQRDEAAARLASSREALLEALNGPRIEDIQAAEASLTALQSKSAGLKKTISYTALLSPSDGTVLTRIKEPGAYVSAGEPVYTLTINSPKWIQAYVDEKNLGKISPGMTAQITSDSYPNKIYSGYIGFISPTAEFTPKSVETPELRTSLVYRLRIIVKDPENRLRQGIPVTVKLNAGLNVGLNNNAKTTHKNK